MTGKQRIVAICAAVAAVALGAGYFAATYNSAPSPEGGVADTARSDARPVVDHLDLTEDRSPPAVRPKKSDLSRELRPQATLYPAALAKCGCGAGRDPFCGCSLIRRLLKILSNEPISVAEILGWFVYNTWPRIGWWEQPATNGSDDFGLAGRYPAVRAW
jgi:hypothetical protein